MRILITGGSGFIGRRLCDRLADAGHEILVVSRRPERAAQKLPAGADVRPRVADFVKDPPEAVVNLAGEPIAEGRWTESKKHELVNSRVRITREVVELCRKAEPPPRVLVSGSAMGYYGDQGDRDVTEETPPNEEFVHELCARWEAEARKAEDHVGRVALLRIGLVLDRNDGMLKKMLPPFKLGLGGPLGDGRQYMPWIHREDIVRMIEFLLEHPDQSGPFNASAPEPVTNEEFTRALGRHLGRPTIFRVPAPVLKLVLGEMSRLLLTGARMVPARFQKAGFEFRYPTLDDALSDIVER
ncbi:MAG: TIGR01777 family oxidoreductase [Wenzhouxiangellaceae bacterium]|nr:TIGR01777 family oxidoreductase [Wenzhouxiangellaceae bacterium]